MQTQLKHDCTSKEKWDEHQTETETKKLFKVPEHGLISFQIKISSINYRDIGTIWAIFDVWTDTSREDELFYLCIQYLYSEFLVKSFSPSSSYKVQEFKTQTHHHKSKSEIVITQ